jgi:thioredoxin 1
MQHSENSTSNNNIAKLVIPLVVLVIGGGLIYFATNRPSTQNNNSSSPADSVSKNTNQNSANISSSTFMYTSYQPSLLAKAETTPTVLFFHASWCPTCKAAEDDINKMGSNSTANLNILKIDYDTATELKQKYKVTQQSTFVLVDKDGNELKKGNGFTSLDAIAKFADSDQRDKASITMESDSVAISDNTTSNNTPKFQYTSYQPSLLAKAETTPTVLFFHASWCPTCKAAEDDINKMGSNSTANLNILKIDYDTATELKQKYKVTQQSTFVLVDKDGNELKKGNGFTSLDAIAKFADVK